MSALLALASLSAATVMTVCGPADGDAGRPLRPLRVSGAGVALPLIKALCDAHAATSRDVRFEFPPSATTLGGVNGVAAGELDIAVISRPLTPREKELGLREVWLALDPLILISPRRTLVESLTTGQVRDIYSGRVRNWSSLGGPNLPITVIDRPENASGKIVFRQMIVGDGLPIVRGAIVVASAEEVESAVYSAPGGIGYTSRGLFLRRAWPDLAVIRLDGVEPDDASVRSGAYPAIRSFGIAVRWKTDGRVDAFIAFAMSPRGRAITEELRLLPR